MNIVLLIIGLVLILGTGFFVAVEFSLVALESSAVQAARAAGDRKADAVLKMPKNPLNPALKLPGGDYHHHPTHRLHAGCFY